MDILSTKEIIKHGTFKWYSQVNKKIMFLFLLLLPLTFWSEMKIQKTVSKKVVKNRTFIYIRH